MAAAVVVLAAFVVAWAAGPIAAMILQARLRDAGWLEAGVVGGSLSLPEVLFERITLNAGDTLVAEDVRARLGPGIERIEIGRLHARALLTGDGGLSLPGAPAATGGTPPVDLIPPDGLMVADANLVVTTPLGDVGLRLVDLAAVRTRGGASLQGAFEALHGDDSAPVAVAVGGEVAFDIDEVGGWRSTLRLDDSRIAAGGLTVAGIAGDAAATGAVGQAPRLELAVLAGAIRHGDRDLGAFTVDAALADGTGELRVESRDGSRTAISIDARLDAGAETRDVRLAGRIAAEESDQANGSPAGAASSSGILTFEADLSIPLDARSADAIRNAVLGRVQVRARNAAWPGVFTQGTIDLSADIEGQRDALRIVFSESTAALVPDATLTPLAAEASGPAGLAVALHPRAEQLPYLQVAFADGSALFDGHIEIRAGDAGIDSAVHAGVSWRPPAGAAAADWIVDAELAGFAARNVHWRDIAFGIEAFDGRVAYRRDEWQIDGAGALGASGLWDAVRVDGLVADWVGTITATDDHLRLTARECVAWRFDGMEIDGLHIAEVSPPCVSAGDGGVLFSRDAGGRSEFAFSLQSEPLTASVATDEATWTVEGAWPQLAVTGASDAAGIESLSARFSDGALSSSRHEVSADGVEGTVDWRNGALTASTLRIASLASTASPAWLAPLAIEAQAAADGDEIEFEASASDPFGTFVLDASGRHAAERTHAALRLYPVRFVPDAVEMADLSPRLAELVSDAAGLVEFEGRVAYGADGLSGDGTLKLDDVDATVSGVPIEGLRTDIRFTNLVPPATDPAQQLTIERVDFGMPLDNGIAVFTLAENGVLAVDRLEFAFAGGRLFGEPFIVDSARTNDIGLVLRAEDVELDSFLASSQIEGLAGSGTLAGRVPVRLTDGRLRLDDGVLAAETDGVLRYSPDDLPDFLRGDDVRSQMLREVLTNFHYDELSLAVSGDSSEGGEQRLTLNARGANPDFLEGHPIELAFNFTGPLLGAVRSAVDVSGAQELEERFERQESENEENSR